MTLFSADDHNSSVGHITPNSIQNQHDTTAQNIVISPMGQSEVPVPGHSFVTNAVMSQEGNDLILESADGVTLVIEGYFSGETPPDLISSDGKVLTPALVKSFIQASTDYAEEPVAMNDVTPVGSVQEVSGNATVTHENGTKEVLAKGMAIYEGDIVETDAKGAVNIEFIDDSSFAVSNNAKMAIDEFVFDTKTHGGENNFSMLRGLFVYTSGLVGREDPDDVKIHTPVGSIGIRGTIITGVLPEEGSSTPAQISVVEGAIVIHANNGTDHTLSQHLETVQIDTSGNMTNIGVISDVSMTETFNVLRTVAPTLFSSIEEGQPEAAPVGTGAPVPVEALPPTGEEAAPEVQETEPPAPAPLPDVIQLNLLPGTLEGDSLEKTLALQNDTDPLKNLQYIGAYESVGISAAPGVAAQPPAAFEPPPVSEQPYTPPEPGVVAPALPPPNLAPVTKMSIYNVDEDAGFKGKTTLFDISRFYSDDHDTTFTYNVTITGGASAVDSIVVSAAGNITFISSGTLGTGSTNPVTFEVTATDSGGLVSSAITYNINVYGPGFYGTSGVDTTDLTGSGKIIDYMGGNDAFDVSGNNNVVFGEGGADDITVTGQNNRIYGGYNVDELSINGGDNNLLSGGADDDILSVNLSDPSFSFHMFGGNGRDTFKITNENARDSMATGSSLIDGGTGFDTLKISAFIDADIRDFAAGSLKSINRIQLGDGSSSTITLDLNDITRNGFNKLYIDVDGNDFVELHDAGGLGNLTQVAGTVNDVLGNTYNQFTNGTVTLYLSTDTTMANVSGAGL